MGLRGAGEPDRSLRLEYNLADWHPDLALPSPPRLGIAGGERQARWSFPRSLAGEHQIISTQYHRET